ncbi:alpha-amylase family glycosyl hydrolase [Micromonospora sp. M12]
MTATPPKATYRIQVRPGFDLDATAAIVDYLADLGVSHLYTAPLLTATPGSQHGYDVVDHRAVNPELGGEAARQRLLSALRDQQLGLVVDIVPNHAGVAVPAANPPGGTCCAEGATRRTPTGSTSTGTGAAAAAGAGRRPGRPGRPQGGRRGAALPRAPLPDRRRHRRRQRRAGARPAALRAGLLASG